VNLAEDAVAQWGDFMLNPTPETLEKLSKFAPVFNEVKKAMATISANQRARYLADQRLKGRLDQGQRESDARQDGRTEGRTEERRTNALGMLEAGATREFVCKSLKITEAQLTELLATPNPQEN